MKKFLLDYGIKVRLPIILFATIASFALTYYITYAERTGIGYQPEQPIAFSHKLHAGDMLIDCQYCHIGVEKSRFASVPALNVCMGCHSLARVDKPEIQKLTKYYYENTPLPWKRVHRVPDFAYFNHSVHVNKGIICQDCHGEVQNMDTVANNKYKSIGQVNSFTMGACLDCHRNSHEKFPNLPNLNKGPESCGTCHR
ncbi:MAG: cytochrome c3 family protein [Ignavibacteria bacterium]